MQTKDFDDIGKKELGKRSRAMQLLFRPLVFMVLKLIWALDMSGLFTVLFKFRPLRGNRIVIFFKN